MYGTKNDMIFCWKCHQQSEHCSVVCMNNGRHNSYQILLFVRFHCSSKNSQETAKKNYMNEYESAETHSLCFPSATFLYFFTFLQTSSLYFHIIIQFGIWYIDDGAYTRYVPHMSLHCYNNNNNSSIWLCSKIGRVFFPPNASALRPIRC